MPDDPDESFVIQTVLQHRPNGSVRSVAEGAHELTMHAPGDGAAAWVRRNVGMPLFNYTHAYVQASAMAERGGRVVNVQTHELRTDEGVAAVLARISRAATMRAAVRAVCTRRVGVEADDDLHLRGKLDEK